MENEFSFYFICLLICILVILVGKEIYFTLQRINIQTRIIEDKRKKKKKKMTEKDAREKGK